jgi:cytochrome c biogenesis protein
MDLPSGRFRSDQENALTTTRRGGYLQTLWVFFCSLRLTISLLIVLAVASVIGTLIPQGPQKGYLEHIGPAKVKIYSALGFFDMYHSWWFILLLYLLTLNIIACSVKRLPKVWKTISEPQLILDGPLEKSLSLSHDFKMNEDDIAIRDRMVSFLKAEFASPVVTEVDGVHHLFAQKAPYCRLGVYVVHTSVIIIFIGAMIGSLFGYKAFVDIVEGSYTSTALNSRNGKPLDLGFALRCEKFSVSFYNTGAPKEYKSILTVLEKGEPVPGFTNVPVIVNNPLTYKGVAIYQSRYGTAGNYQFSVRLRNRGLSLTITARQGERIPLPDGSTMQLLETVPDVSRFMPQLSGAAARIETVSPQGDLQQFVLFRNYPRFDEKRGGDLIFTFEGMDERYYTGLQVAKDPGVRVVWLGCVLMVVGICMAFYLSHRRIWIRIAHGRITMAGSASKNPEGFRITFDNMVEKLKKL